MEKEYKPEYRKEVNQQPFTFKAEPGLNTPQLEQNISIQI